MGTLIFCVVVAIIVICVIFGKDDILEIDTFFVAVILGLIIGGLIGLVGTAIPTVIVDNNLDCYSLETRSDYDLIRQTFDDNTYFVKEKTKDNICYKFEYSISDKGRNISVYDDVFIEYNRTEKPHVTIEHYEPNIWLKLFTFCSAKDYYYITLNNQNDLSISFD